MDKDNSTRIEDILKEIRELKEQHDKRAGTGEFFNVFSIDGVKIDEDRHSAILADLLNPNGSHRQKAVFLKHFLNLEFLGLVDSFDYGELEGFHVERKAKRKYGEIEIDILLEKDDTCIIIENKIKGAQDRCSQLNKYYRYAKESFTDEQIKLIYLTLYGGVPSEKSLRGVDGREALDVGRVIRMSYKSAIVGWLENCLADKDATKATPIREVLFQYQEHIKNLTNQLTKEDCSMDNKIVSILANNYDLITELEDSIPKAKKHIQNKFWEELAKKITQVCGLEAWEDDMETRRIFKVSGCKSPPSFEIALMVELLLCKGVWYGFVLLENDSQVGKCEEKQFKKYVNLVHEALETRDTNEWVLGWKYLKDRNEANLFSDFGTEQMCYIAEDDELKKTVETFAQEIKDAVDKFVKAKETAGL